MRKLFYFLCFLLVAACEKTEHAPGERLVILHDKTPLRDSCSTQSREIALLKEGEIAWDLHETSRHISKIVLEQPPQFGRNRRQEWEEPWVRIVSFRGDTGWVFLPQVGLYARDGKARDHWFFKRRMEARFGKALAERCFRFFDAAVPKNTSAEFAAWFREHRQLKDTLNLILPKIMTPDTNQELPDMTWLNQLSDTWVLQRVEAGSAWQIFENCRRLYAYSEKTAGEEDNLYVRAVLSACPPDSIEAVFPAWKMEIGENEAASLLGKDKHSETLQAIYRAWNAGELFHPELKTLKDKVLEDILGKNTQFWQTQEEVVGELSKIIQAGFGFFSEQDNIALRARLKVLQNASANGIRVNLRAG